jgi:hypothetical protein
MINKITSVTPKKLFPVVAAGLILTGCATIQQYKTKEYCLGTNRTETEYWDIMNKMGSTKADQQARLDSLAFRDIFNGTQLANDSAAIADFNKIYQNRLYTENCEKFLKENDISMEDYDYIINSKQNDAKRQFEADYFLYNKFFEQKGLKTQEVNDKIERTAFYLYPPHHFYYYEEVFSPNCTRCCPTTK